MSDFTVLRSLDGYCLVLDKKRIAGSKPDYRGENVLVDWTTEVVYGPVDDLAAENAKLRELVEDMLSCIEIRAAFGRPPTEDMYEQFAKRARELGVEVDA